MNDASERILFAQLGCFVRVAALPAAEQDRITKRFPHERERAFTILSGSVLRDDGSKYMTPAGWSRLSRADSATFKAVLRAVRRVALHDFALTSDSGFIELTPAPQPRGKRRGTPSDRLNSRRIRS